MQSTKFVVRSEFPDEQAAMAATRRDAVSSLVLHPLEQPGAVVRFDAFTSVNGARATGGDACELVIEVNGPWVAPASYAVFADWHVDDAARTAAFEESRQRLFELRRQHLPTFARDWLLKWLDHVGRYTVLGLYGDQEGLQLSRAHPEIQRFAQQHPPAQLAATDVSGLRFFRVATPTRIV